MCAEIVARVVMVVPGRHHPGFAQHEGDMAIDRREHEARRNQGPQEKHSEDEQGRPLGNTPIPHPGHHMSIESFNRGTSLQRITPGKHTAEPAEIGGIRPPKRSNSRRRAVTN
jgi:hypothetical protein